MGAFYLSAEMMEAIDQTMASLTASGVTAAECHSGEMNFSGCASGYCQAWA